MKWILFLAGLYAAFSGFAQTKQVCFTFDDLPVVSYGMNDTVFQRNMMNRLMGSLNENGIPTIGFVNERKLYYNDNRDSFQVSLLASWLNSGLDLGNHSWSHFDYNVVSCDVFTKDILKGEPITSQLLAQNGKQLSYFRHPFLHIGNTKEKADSLDRFLVEHGYQVAPVTIDNDDYLFAVAYKRAYVQNDTILMNQIGSDFLNYMEQKIVYYEKQSQALFGRNINQILLLHTSLLNADYTGSLAQIFIRHGYQFVDLKQALSDVAYQTPVTVYGNWGISWIDRWALSQGYKGDFFKDEPITPNYIKQLSK